jgi:two-component system, response regulator, stage 0 sporulation protein A
MNPLILILEPDPLQRDLMSLTLQNMSCEVLTTVDNLEARRLLQQRKPDVLIIDTFLPKANGLDLLKSFKLDNLLAETQVVVVSAMGFEEIVRQVVQLGVSNYLVKPVDLELLATRVQRIIGGTSENLSV